MSFANVPLWYNRAAIFFVNVAKENKRLLFGQKNAFFFFFFMYNISSINKI